MKPPLRLAATALLCITLLVACQPASVLNTVTPSGAYTLTSGVPYEAHERQRMDIYVPSDGPVKEQVVVFVYGGSWDSGDKGDFEFIGQAFARLGYVTIIPNYRLYPEVEFPKFIDDIAMALRALPVSLEQSCPSGHQVILAGHSAGAHTAALIAADASYRDRHQAQNIELSALIGLAGPYDLPLEHERVKEKFTQVEGDEANPIALATTQVPPTLLIHGESDSVAKPEHSEKFKARLQELGVHVTMHTYSRRRHVDLVASLASPLRFWSPAYNDIQDFLQAQGLDRDCPID